MNSLSRSGNNDSGSPGAISDSICARMVGSSLPKPVSISIAASGSVSRYELATEKPRALAA